MNPFKPKSWRDRLEIKLNSVQEYFALPKKDREWRGLYKVPYALPWELSRNHPGELGWDAFYERIKKEYPVQHFFRRWLTSFDNPVYSFFMSYVYWPLRDFKYNTIRWVNPLYPRWRASLPRHKYSDIPELFIASNFGLIRDFYWEEVVDGIIDWSATDDHRKFHAELTAYVHWIEEEYPKMDELFSKALNNASNIEGDYYTKYKEFNDLEIQKQNKETEILTWFVNNRGYFWT